MGWVWIFSGTTHSYYAIIMSNQIHLKWPVVPDIRRDSEYFRLWTFPFVSWYSPNMFLFYRSSSRSSSRSHSPEDTGKVEFITEFSHPVSGDQPTKKAGGDSQSHSSSSRSVCFTLLSARTVSSFRLTVRTQTAP